MNSSRRSFPGRLLGWGLLAVGLIAAFVGALVALPEYGAELRALIDAPLPERHERVGALRWLVTPIEKNAFVRRFTTIPSLNDLAVMEDGRTVFVVGADGILLESSSAGATWESLEDDVKWSSETIADLNDPPALLPNLQSVATSPDGRLAIAVGTSGTVLTSADSGQTWTELDPSGTWWNLTSVAFNAGTGRAIAVGGGGTVLTSEDSGVTWTKRTSGASVQLHSVAFDAGTGRAIAVGGGGTVLISEDSGETWTKRASGTSVRLHSVAFDAGTGHVIVVGELGTVLTSKDNGATWTTRAPGVSAQLDSIAFDAGTGRAIAVGGGGTVLTSEDSGETWTERASGAAVQFHSVAFDAGTGHVIVVGELGTVLTSKDNGATWSIVVPKGRIYASPLSVLGLLLSFGGVALLGFGGLPLLRYNALSRSELHKGIVDLFVSDRPLGPSDPDRLGYDLYIQGLSGLLRNTGTGFPITIAVTGEWGAGKSSFMRLLEADLKRRGYFAAWFNAWHDQNEENVLSSLLLAIRKGAVPRIFSRKFVRAINLRFYLLCRRGIIYFMVGMVAIALAFFVVRSAWQGFGDLPGWKEVSPAIQANIGTYKPFYVTEAAVEAACDKLSEQSSIPSDQFNDCKLMLDHPIKAPTAQKRIWSNAASLRKEIESRGDLPGLGYTVEVEWALLDKVAHVATPSLPTVFGKLWPNLLDGLWQWLTGFVAAAILFANGVSTFGFNLRRGAFGFWNAAANSVDPAGRHERLRDDFENVSRSIGRNLVIFIDDLDRCQPEKVVETLEAVNFLVTAGECAVIVGMDYRRVQRSVGLVRKDLAVAESTGTTSNDIKSEHSYAHRYLQKLVNVEMPIAAGRDRLKNVVTKPGSPTEEQRTLDPLWRWLALLWKLRVWAILLGLAVSVHLVVPHVHDALVPQPFEEVGTNPNLDDKGQSSVRRAQPQLSQTGGQQDPPADGTMEPALNATPAIVFWPVVVGFFLILIVGLLQVLHWLHERGRLELRGFFAAWLRRLSIKPEEVRDSKAFEMALQIWLDAVAYDDPTPRTIKRFLNRLRYFAAMQYAKNEKNFDWEDEANLVALAALHHLKIDFSQTKTSEQSNLFAHVIATLRTSDDESLSARDEKICEACKKHLKSDSWQDVDGYDGQPPLLKTNDIKEFRKLVAGIHV